MNLSHLLSHITAMIEAAHPKPILTPPRLCRALVTMDDGHCEVGKAFELAPNKMTDWSWRALRTADHVVTVVQLGNVPIVLWTVSVQGLSVLSGPALTIRFKCNVGDEICLCARELECQR